MLIITPLETTKYRRARPPPWERVGTKPPARLQLLREDPCVIKDSAFRAKYADIFEKQTTILSWTWRIYGIHITTKYRRALPPRWERVGTKPPARLQLLQKGPLRNQRFSISRKIRRYIRAKTHYSIMDMKDIRYTIRQGRYSDKQTTKRSFPIPALV